MGARQFTDAMGRAWIAWNVTPAPRPGRPAAEGWVVFETMDGREKRRLLAYPAGWDELEESELHALLESAGAARPSKLSFEPGSPGGPPASIAMQAPAGASSASPAPPSSPSATAVAPTAVSTALTPVPTPPVAPRAVTPASQRAVKSFRYPNGRLWSICVVRRAIDGVATLRFSAGARHVHLDEWPDDWMEMNEAQLMELLRSVPREPGTAARTDATPRRRHDDPRG